MSQIMSKYKKALLFIVFVVSVFGLGVFRSQSVSAAVTDLNKSILEKMVYQGVYNCYKDEHMKSLINPLSDYNLAEEHGWLVNDSGQKDGQVTLITDLNYGGYVTKNKGDNNNANVDCKEFFDGETYYDENNDKYEKIRSVFDFADKSVPHWDETNKVIEFMENMGYTVTEREKTCYNLRYKEKDTNGNSRFTNSVCQDKDGNISVDGDDSYWFSFHDAGDGKIKFTSRGETRDFSKGSGENFDYNAIIDLVYDTCGTSKIDSDGCYNNISYKYYIFEVDNPGVAVTNNLANYAAKINSNLSTAAGYALKYLSNGKYSSPDSIMIKNDSLDKRILYQHYLTQYYNVEVTCQEKAGSYTEIWWYDEGSREFKKCWYNETGAQNTDKKVNGVNRTGWFEQNSLSLEGLIDALQWELPNTYTEEEIEEAGEEYVGTDFECEQADLNGQGWILCPILSNTTTTVDGLASTIDEMLKVDSELYDSDSGTYKAWAVFRDLANIAMIVVFLVIIFSQVTGVGINNYGIKKMLPKFIVMAILINLSYVLCQVAVDLSNMLGHGLDNLFRGVAEGVAGGNVNIFSTSNWISTFVSVLLGGAGAAGAIGGVAVTAVAAFTAGPLLIISLVLSVLVALVAALMFFVSLGARMIIVIAFVAISPLALACYVLPNTQGMFKKWLDVFKTALIIYPICGALYGISFIIKAIFLKTEGGGVQIGLWEGVALIITPFLPFIALPTLLKGALSKLGTIGGALTSVGNGLRSGLSSGNSALKETEAYRMQKEEGGRVQQERRAQNLVDKLKKKRESGDLSEKDTRRLARATGTLDKLQRENRDAKAIIKEKEFEENGITTLDGMMTEWENAYVSGNDDELEAISRVMMSSFGSSAAGRMAEVMATKDAKYNLVDAGGVVNKNIEKSIARLRDMTMHDSTFNNAMRNKGSDAFGMITSGGIGKKLNSDGTDFKDAQGNLVYEAQNLDYFSKHNGISTSASDWSTQATKTIERGVEEGGFTSEMAMELLTSDNPSIRSGILSEEKKVDAILGALEDDGQVVELLGRTDLNANVRTRIEKYAKDHNLSVPTPSPEAPPATPPAGEGSLKDETTINLHGQPNLPSGYEQTPGGGS